MNSRKILWVRLDAIGDTLLAASMLEHLHGKFGGARVTVVCEAHTAELYEASPFVERVIGVEKMKLFFDSKYRDEIVLQLREEAFDIAVDSTCSWSHLSDLFIVGSQARERVAFENEGQIPPETMARRKKVFTRLVKFARPYEPEMERYKDFLKELGIEAPGLNATVWTTAEDEEFARATFTANGLVLNKTVALFAFGRSHLRTYPYYGEALAGVCRENGYTVIGLGDSAAYGFNESCLNNIGVRSINLSGKTTLRQTASLLRMCRIAVGAETGLAHMACAVGTPNVIVIGGGHIGRFMPYSPRTSLVTLPLECFDCDWSCRFEKAHCVADVDPSVVEFAVRETLRTDSPKPRMFVHARSLWDPEAGKPSWELAGKFVNRKEVEIISVEFGASLRKRVAPNSVRARDERPAEVENILQTAVALREAGEVRQALASLDVARPETAGFPELLNLKAELNIQLGSVETAKEILWGTIVSFPFNVQILNNIAVVEIVQGRYESALGVLRRLLDIEPGNEYALANLRHIEGSLAQVSKLVGAEQSILHGDFQSAREMLASVLESNSSNEDALTDLAVVEMREGRNSEALRRLQEVLARNPENEYALRLMEKILLKEEPSPRK